MFARGWFAALGIAVLAASPVRAEDALAADMVARLQKAYPAFGISFDAPDDRIDVTEGGKVIAHLYLDNLRAICNGVRPDCDEQKQRRVAMIAEQQERKDEAFDLGKVRAVVRPVSYIEAIRRQFAARATGKPADEAAKYEEALPFARPFGRGLARVWVIDTPNGMSPISAGVVSREKLSADALDSASSKNMQSERMPALKRSSSNAALWLAEGNDYLPSVLVDEALWKRVAGDLFADEATLCLPMRHVLVVYFPQLDKKRELDFPALCRRMGKDAAPLFSDEVIQRIGDNWQIR